MRIIALAALALTLSACGGETTADGGERPHRRQFAGGRQHDDRLRTSAERDDRPRRQCLGQRQHPEPDGEGRDDQRSPTPTSPTASRPIARGAPALDGGAPSSWTHVGNSHVEAQRRFAGAPQFSCWLRAAAGDRTSADNSAVAPETNAPETASPSDPAQPGTPAEGPADPIPPPDAVSIRTATCRRHRPSPTRGAPIRPAHPRRRPRTNISATGKRAARKKALDRADETWRGPAFGKVRDREPSMTITITAFESSPDRGQGLARDMRVRWALEEVGQPYDVRLVSFEAMKAARASALHPFGQIPTYEEGDLVLFESGAIVFHIAERHPGLLPDDAERPGARRSPGCSPRSTRWSRRSSTLERHAPGARQALVRGAPADARRARPRPAGPALRPARRRRLARRRFQRRRPDDGDGAAPAGADRACSSDYPNLAAYVARGEARPAYQRAFADSIWRSSPAAAAAG